LRSGLGRNLRRHPLLMRGPRPTRGNKGPRPGNRRAEYALVLSAVLFVAALTVATALVGADGIVARLRQLGPGTLAGLLALSLANYGARPLRWHAFGRQLGMDVPLGHTALYYLARRGRHREAGKIIQGGVTQWNDAMATATHAPRLSSSRIASAT